jgi:hypothetical protein
MPETQVLVRSIERRNHRYLPRWLFIAVSYWEGATGGSPRGRVRARRRGRGTGTVLRTIDEPDPVSASMLLGDGINLEGECCREKREALQGSDGIGLGSLGSRSMETNPLVAQHQLSDIYSMTWDISMSHGQARLYGCNQRSACATEGLAGRKFGSKRTDGCAENLETGRYAVPAPAKVCRQNAFG